MSLIVDFRGPTTKFVEEKVSFLEHFARTFEKEVVEPAVKFIKTQFQRPVDVIEQQKALDKLQESLGSDFFGDDYHTPDLKTWMAHLPAEKLTLSKIVWPGTHESATNGIGDPLFTRWLGECQTLSIFDQLVLGTRVLDIRVQEDGKICHGIMTSYDIEVVLNDVIRFLSETQSEIIILEIRTEFGQNDPPEFESYLVDKLGQFLISQDDNLFDKLVSEILPKRVICIWKPRRSPRPRRGGLLWSSDYLKEDWIDTDLPWTKFQRNMIHLREQPPVSSRKFFYRVENTLTPQADSEIVWIRPLSYRIRKYARLFISWCVSEGCIDKLQIFSTDFIDEDFVDACVRLTQARIDKKF